MCSTIAFSSTDGTVANWSAGCYSRTQAAGSADSDTRIGRAEVVLTLSMSIVSFLLVLYPSDPCKVLSFMALPTLIITLVPTGLYSSGHPPSCGMEEEIVSHTTFLTSIFLPGCCGGMLGPGQVS